VYVVVDFILCNCKIDYNVGDYGVYSVFLALYAGMTFWWSGLIFDDWV